MEIKKGLFVVAGTLCVVLGVLGMFLPLLPTTPFLLLAAFFYARSSERFYERLLNNRWCGKYIRNYREGKGIAMRQKIVTIAILWITIGYGIWFMGSVTWLNLLLLGIAVGVTIHLIRIKTYRPGTETIKSNVEIDPLEETS